MFVKFIALSCLVATVACAPRRAHVAPSASQVVPQAVAAPDQVSKLATAQQAKLHYVEIGPSLKGDYKFGYDTGSGPAGQSFREETRLDDGTVKGAYGYVDANGKQRIVKYTAGKNGFVIEGDQEAPGQAGAALASPQQPEARRPQPVVLPAQHQQPAQPTFDEQPVAINRATPSLDDRARAEQQHAEQLRQHQLAQQAALAQQQRLAQQIQLQQQQQIVAQRAQAQHQDQHQHQHQHQPQHQHPHQHQQQFTGAPLPAPHPPAHQVVDPQNGQFFSSSSDANLNQLLANQLRQLQSGNQFAGQFQPPQASVAQAQAPQHFAAQAAPAFQAAAPQQFGSPQAQPAAPALNFGSQQHQQFRGTRQVPAAPQQFQHQPTPGQTLSPQAALIALHQQQQHDAQVLASLRAQQLSQLQHQQQQQKQAAPAPQFQQADVQPQIPKAPQPQPQLAGPVSGSPVAVVSPTPQPEVFGPPVIDIRTLNYSIGQQTRVN